MLTRYRHLIIGLSLGCLALIGYSLEASLAPDFPLSVSHVFIIFAALAAGPEVALIAFAIGSLPSTLFDEGCFRYTVQAAVITGGVLAHRRWFEETPSYLVVLVTWLLVLIPLHELSPEAQWHNAIPSYFLGLQALMDVFLTATASSLLFIPWVCENILQKPFQPNRERLFSANLGMLLSLVALSGVLIGPTLYATPNLHAPLEPALGTLLIFTVLIVGLAAFGARWLEATVRLLSHHETCTRMSASFSSSELFETQPSFPPTMLNNQPVMEFASTVVVPPGVCAIDAEGRVLFANHRFKDLIQTSEKELNGRRLFDISMDNQIRAALQDFASEDATKEKISGEFKLNEMPERLRYFSLTIEPYDNGENTPGRLMTLQEITDRRTIESHLLEAQKMKNLGSVMGSIAHAFNNSLTAIIGRASFALRVQDRETQRIALDEIRIQAQKAGELVWKLLDFSEGKPTQFQQLSVEDLIEEQRDLLQKLVGEGFQLQITNEHKDDLWISGDSNLLMQVLTELVTNAKDAYRENHGNIRLSVASEQMDDDIAKLHPGARAGEYVRITVSDTGCGMSPEMISQAFAPLVSTKTKHGNSGLGLSIVYAILRAHDGFLLVESFPEKGTTISVYIPTCAYQEEMQSSKGEKEGRPTLQNIKNDANILVVEDEPEVRDLLGKMLEMLGYKVTTCRDAEEASDAYNHSHFDLLLVDFMMPQMNGLDLIKNLKNAGKEETRYILMSGCGRSTSSKDDGDITHLSKPFDLDTLGSTVSKALS